MSIEIDPKYDYLLSKITFPDTRDEFIVHNGVIGIDAIYQNAISSGIRRLGENAVGKSINEIIDAAGLADPARKLDL
jgi:hypothetical protein